MNASFRTSAAEPAGAAVVEVRLDPLELSEDEFEYIYGAYIERQAQVRADGGGSLTMVQFVRQALIAASAL